MANYYLAPHPFSIDSSPERLLGWSRELINAGQTFLRQQPAYPFIQEGLDLVNGELHRVSNNALSDARTDSTVRNLKELIASQTNIRIVPAFSTEIAALNDQKAVLNKAFMAWQTMTFADRGIRTAWQYACAAGTGYVGLRWDPNFWSKGKGDIALDAYGPMDVLPIGLPKSNKLQSAYAVALKVEAPYHEVIRAHPEFREQIVPKDSGVKPLSSVRNALSRVSSIVLDRFSGIHRQQPVSWATVDVYYIYIDDDSVNDTGHPIQMGEPGTNWVYTVPSLGDDIIAEWRDGQPLYRKARPDDCRLYPNRRLIKVIDNVVLNPDPILQTNPYWGGRVPLVQLRADDWPWGFLGFPLTKAGASIEKANLEIFRSVVDSCNARLSPARAYDKSTVSQALANSLNPRVPNQTVGIDMAMGPQQFTPLLPPEYYNFPVQILQFLADNESRIKNQMGVADATALAQARQLPAADTTERILESLGPLIRDQSRNMEASIRDFGECWKHFFFQFYKAPKLMQLLGPKGDVEEVYEFPGVQTLVSKAPPGAPVDASYFDRAKIHAGNFTFTVTPYSLHEITSLTRKMFHLQLARSGFPIDWWTLAEVFDIMDFGPKPMVDDPERPGQKKEATTVLERWIAQNEITARFQAALMAQAAALGMNPGGQMGPGQGKGGGRPPSGQQPPTMDMQSDGRPVVRESPK